MKKYMVLGLLSIIVVCVMATPAWAEAIGTTTAPLLPIDLTPLFQVAITTLAAIITAKLIPWIKRRATAEQQAALNLLTRTLVYAAEQIFRNEKESGNKKLMYVKAKLLERGYDIDLDAIEAAVMEMKLEEPWALEAESVVEFKDLKPPDVGDKE